MLNLKKSYIKITDNLYITDAISNDVECKLLCLGNKINIYGQISIVEKQCVIQPICGDIINSDGWYDMEKDEIDIYCRQIENLINSKEYIMRTVKKVEKPKDIKIFIGKTEENLTQNERENLEKHFEESIDLYLNAKGIRLQK